MGSHSRVRLAKCQLLATCFFTLLLGLSMGILTILTHYGGRSVIIHATSPDDDLSGSMYYWAFSLGIFLTSMLTLGVVLSTLGVVREAKGLMAGGFISFALVFLVAVQVTFWRYREPSKVENSVLDTYDLVYEQAMRNVSDIWWQRLVAMHDTGCLQEIRSLMREHLRLTTLLLIITLAFMVYGMFLTSFLWLTIHYGRSLDRKGRYTLTPQ
ncbi:tetraspanin-32 isoform X3 [Petaurus breviceps papuanus]|uniref:tetraspanin-32 isoform X3 n=1 Tax=Petaurus breviceps papuanus TaxID=3040969 RepID=UPI0036DB657E